MNNSEPAWFNPVTNLAALLVGAALSYYVTWSFERRREKSKQKAQAFALIFSMQRICNDLMQLTNVLRDISSNRAAEIASGVPLWQLMPINFGWDEEVVIRPEELALLAGTRKNDLVTKVQEANSAHRIFTRAAIRVSELKLELVNSGLAASAVSEVVTFTATETEYAGIAPIITQLDALCSKLGCDLAEATHQAVECAKLVAPALKHHYKFDHLAGLVFDDLSAMEDLTTPITGA